MFCQDIFNIVGADKTGGTGYEISLDVYKRQEMEIALKETQTRFYALDLRNAGHDFSIDDGFNLIPELNRLINHDIELNRQGKQGRTILKMNALQDPAMIDRLYEA